MGANTAERDAAQTGPETLAPADAVPAWTAWVAAELARLGLSSSARLLLLSLRPMGWLGGQALWAAQPVLALFGGGDRTAHLARTLEDDTQFAALIAALAPAEES